MPIRHILYPTDFSETARYAGQYAATFARKLGASLDVLHVPAVRFPEQADDVTSLDFARYREAGRLEAAALMKTFLQAEEFCGLTVRAIVSGLIPEDEILRTAAQSDLIVIGTHGRTGLSWIMLGSVTEKVVGAAPCPVLVVKHPDVTVELPWGGVLRGRRKVGPPRLLNILAPLDGSLLSESLLPHVQELARGFEAVVTLLLVICPSLSLNGKPVGDVDAGQLAEAERYLVGHQQALRAEGVMVEAVIRTGDAATEILDYAEEREADLTATTTHGQGGLKRWFVGSVANKILRGSDIPVLLRHAWTRAT